jgi:hypothetical protein
VTTSQSKQILSVATRALALLNPEWQVTAELRQMLESANSVQAPAVKNSCVLCSMPTVATDRVEGFLGKKLKPGFAHALCAASYRRNAAEFSAWCAEQNAKVIAPFDAEAAALCTCGGNADSHAKDELENLLKCSHCDTCEAFHYDVDEKERQAA